MPKEHELEGKHLERGKSLSRTDNVLVFVRLRAMDQLKAFHQQGAGGKLTQEVEVLRSKGLTGPECGELCQNIEILGITQACASFVVIPADDRIRQLTHARDHCIWIGTIPHQIAEADRRVVFAVCKFKATLECLQVWLNIAEHQISHAGPKTPLYFIPYRHK